MGREADRAEVANQSRDLLCVVADLTLTQLGIPGALACWRYLAGRWRVYSQQDGADPEGS
jgi:hypothetical protein